MNMMTRKIDIGAGTTGPVIRAGRYEEAALPHFRSGPVNATLDPQLADIYLSCRHIHIYKRQGETRVCFSLTIPGSKSPARRSARLEGVEDISIGSAPKTRCFVIRTTLVMGLEAFPIRLHLTETRLRTTDLVVGRSLTGHRFHVDRTTCFALGTPRHRLVSTFEAMKGPRR